MDTDEQLPRAEAASKELQGLEDSLAYLIAHNGEENELVASTRACLDKAKAKSNGHAILKDVTQISSAQLALSAHSGKQTEDFVAILKVEKHYVAIISEFLDEQRKYVQQLKDAQAQCTALLTGWGEQLEVLKGRAEALRGPGLQPQSQAQQPPAHAQVEMAAQLQPQQLTAITATFNAILDRALAELPGDRRQELMQGYKNQMAGVIEPMLSPQVLAGAPGTPGPIEPGQENQPPTSYGKAQADASALREAREAAVPYVAPADVPATAAAAAGGTG